MTRTEEELRKEYEEYSRMYNNPKHWEGWLIDEIGRVENSLEEVYKLAEFLTIEAGKHSKRCKELEHRIEPTAEAYDCPCVAGNWRNKDARRQKRKRNNCWV